MRSVLRELAIGALISCLVVLIGCLVIGLAAGFYYYPIITSVVVAPLVLLLILGAITFVRFLIVREGKEVSFEFLGRFVMSCFNLTGFYYDANGDIVPGVGPNTFGGCWAILRLGGLVLYLWPFVRPVPYREQNEDDGFGDGYNVHLNEMQEELVLEKAETTEAGDNSIALDIRYAVKWRIVNPRRYRYIAPKDAKKQVVNRLHGAQRGWVKAGNENHAQSAKGNGVLLWDELVDPAGINAQTIFDDISQKWGLEIIKYGIVVTDIGYDAEYQAALKSKRQEELLAEGTRARIFKPIMDVLPRGSKLTTEQAFRLRGLDMGATADLSDSKKTLDVQSGGQPINPNFAGVIGAAEAIGDAVARALGKGGSGGKNPKPGNPSGGGSGGGNPGAVGKRQTPTDPAARARGVEAADKYFKKYGKYPPWDPDQRTPN